MDFIIAVLLFIFFSPTNPHAVVSSGDKNGIQLEESSDELSWGVFLRKQIR